ncbi:hypothetical protein BH23DEI1_BH23DEI1_14080 [soil metagenome]
MKKRATLTSKGQITIPLEVRRRLGLKKGDHVTFSIEDGRTVLQPMAELLDDARRAATAHATYAQRRRAGRGRHEHPVDPQYSGGA